jgi:SPP1 family predicted phage head-tail adaptor
MRAGSLRWRIAIEQSVSSQNTLGEPVQAWIKLTEVWAEKLDLIGREYFAASQTLGESVTRFRMRYVAGIATRMRVNCDGDVYNIISVADPNGRRADLVLDTTRKL